jgi:acetyl esterase/lipase
MFDIPKRESLKIIGMTGIMALTSGCSTLTAFNMVTPKDKGTVTLKTNVAYGPDPRQAYDVYGPETLVGPTDKAAPLPVIVFFYGGSWNSGSKADYAWVGRSLAALGYVAVLSDYRLVPNVRYPEFVEDCGAAIRHVLDHADDYYIDKNRLTLMGHSAGAYNAMMVALVPEFLGYKQGQPNPVKAPSPVKAMISLAGPLDFYPFDVAASIEAFGAAPDPKATQPVERVKPTQTKFLLLQSAKDKVVGLKNATHLAARLKAVGADVTLIRYDKGSHEDMVAALSIPFRDRLPVRRDIDIFLGRVFKG